MTRWGLHASPMGHTDRSIATFAAAHPAAIVWLGGNHGPQDGIRYTDAWHLVRLPTPEIAEGVGTYARRVSAIITPWLAVARNLATLSFIPGNEPEYADKSDVQIAWNLAEWLAAGPNYAAALRAMYPGIRLAAPALMAQHTDQLTPAYVGAFDAVTAHCYWQITDEPGIRWHLGGGAYTHALSLATGKPVIVTEVGVVSASGVYSDGAMDWDRRNQQIAQWRLEAVMAGVHAACWFVTDASPDFACFDVGPEAVTDAEARYQALVVPPEPQPQPMPEPQPMSLWDAIQQTMHDRDTRIAMLMGAAIETGQIDAPFPDQYGGGPGRGPYQIEAGPGGSHTGEISEGGARDPLTATQFMAGAYTSAAQSALRENYPDDATYYATIAYRAERPAVMYPADRIARAWALISPVIGIAPTPAHHRYQIVTPVDGPVAQGSDGTFSHAGASPGFYAIDYAVDRGTPCRAVADGTVGVIYTTDWNPISARTGPSIWIDHDNGYSTFSCHLSHIDVVTGQRVTQGQIIGLTGDPTIDGGYSGNPPAAPGTDPHLHWEVWGTASHVRVKMEDLEAAGIAGPYDATEEEMTMFSDSPIDMGMAAIAFGSLGVSVNPQAAIFTDWVQKVYREGKVIGVPTNDEKDMGDGRILQVFSTGVVAEWNRNDNIVRWHGRLPA